MKRSPMKRTGFKRKPAKARTPQQQRKSDSDAEFRRERNARYEEVGRKCERCHRALNGSYAGHHVVRRSNFLDHQRANLRILCHQCHDHIHANVGEAKLEGWIATKWPQIA